MEHLFMFQIVDEEELDFQVEVYWNIGSSAFDIYDNRPGFNTTDLLTNRISAYQLTGDVPFSQAPVIKDYDIYPITIPDGATKLCVTVPDTYQHGVIFWNCNESSTTIVCDYGWHGFDCVYELSNYPGCTHITVNVKRSDNGVIEYDGDFSDFIVTFV